MIENNKSVIMRKNENLRSENARVKSQLHKVQTATDKLKSEHDTLAEQNKENLIQLQNLQKTHDDTQLALKRTEIRYQDLEAKAQQLKTDLEEQENLRRIFHDKIQDLQGNIRVFCRIRPPMKDEGNKQLCSILFPDENTLEIRKARQSIFAVSGKPTDLKQEFVFDKVFPPETGQSEVFEELSQLVQSVVDGFHVCVFAYGQTGSGKTYTMQGSQQDHGMIPRTIDLIFEKINKFKHCGWNYEVTASFLEIYNESVKDLLCSNSSCSYELKFNEGRGVTVTNLKIMPINSAIELKILMEQAHKNRAVAATDFNEHSSRSHAITKIHLRGHNNVTKVVYNGSINLIDLAGSESARTSSAERLNETKSINKSLSALGNVMLALHNKDSHVPYRNSKLTFLLQSCLGGNSKTLMFVNISPFEECYGESVNSLRFAA
ncbi:claret segregational, partial [Asbolus verrucosus]